MAWERCGSTLFYRKPEGDPPGARFASPVHWSQIQISEPEKRGRQAGMVSVLYDHAEGYDWDALKRGVADVADDAGRRREILRYTHEWFSDTIRMSAATPTERFRAFQEAPREARESVLEGVVALIMGLELAKAEGAITGEPARVPLNTQVVWLLPEGSRASMNVDKIRQEVGDEIEVLPVTTIEKGLEDLLARIGILEC